MLSSKFSLGLSFLLVLLLLGTADALLTRGTMVLPSPAPVAERAGESGPDAVLAAIARMGILLQETREENVLRRVVPAEILLTARTLLQNGDRIGSVTFLENARAKALFASLKQALLPELSPETADLSDHTELREGKPVRAILTFRDASLSSERLLFIRVRERLFEFHIAEGKEALLDRIVEEVTQ